MLNIKESYLDVSIDSGPSHGVCLSEENQGPCHDRNVLQNLLLHFSKSCHMSEVSWNCQLMMNLQVISTASK